jgi:hypothetical protein
VSAPTRIDLLLERLAGAAVQFVVIGGVRWS